MKLIGRRLHGIGYCLCRDCTQPLTRRERRRQKRATRRAVWQELSREVTA